MLTRLVILYFLLPISIYSQLSRIERGKINTSIYQLYKILTALNVPMNTFVKVLKSTIVKLKKEKRKKRKNEKEK